MLKGGPCTCGLVLGELSANDTAATVYHFSSLASNAFCSITVLCVNGLPAVSTAAHQCNGRMTKGDREACLSVVRENPSDKHLSFHVLPGVREAVNLVPTLVWEH